MIVWYTVDGRVTPRQPFDLGTTPYNLGNPREQAAVIELCAAHWWSRVRLTRQYVKWPIRVRLYDSEAPTPPLVSMEVDMEMLPSFTAYTHTAEPAA